MKKIPLLILMLTVFAFCSSCALSPLTRFRMPDRAPEPTVVVPQASQEPAPTYTPDPTPIPTAEPTPIPTPEPTPEPTPVPRTFEELAPTTTMSFEELVGDNGVYEKVVDYPPAGTYRVVVDLRYQLVIVFEKDAQGQYLIPVRYMVCSSGGNGNSTPTGTFKSGDHKVRFGLFVNDNVYGQYWTQITGRIYFHSLLYSARNAKTYTTSSYKNLGKAASHGCVRLLVPDARWLYYNIAPGTEVEVRYGNKGNEILQSIKDRMVRAPLPEDRPNLKAGEIPHTDVWSIDAFAGKTEPVPI